MKNRKKNTFEMFIILGFMIIPPIICARIANESFIEAKELPPLSPQVALTLKGILYQSIAAFSFISFSFALFAVKQREEAVKTKKELQEQINQLKLQLSHKD